MSDDRPFCQDCGIRSDLGNKCRTCYAKWSRRLYADTPDHLADLTYVAKELNKMPQSQRKAVAAKGLGKKPDVEPSEKAVELLRIVKKSLEGPYGPQLEMKLQAILSASAETKARSRDGEVD